MSFRVTQNLLNNIVLKNLNSNIQRLLETQTQLSSGKRLTKPSDDPVGTASAMRLHTQINETVQFGRNIGSGETQLNLSDAAFDDMSDLIMRAQELAIGQANTTADANTRQAVAQEIDGILNQFVDILNTKVGNRYIFGGHESLDAPFTQSASGVEYIGDSGEMNIEIESGTLLNVNIPGSLLLPTSVDDLGAHANLNPYTERSIALNNRLLTELNQGSGVDDGFIKITNRSGQTANVDLQGVKELWEVAFKITNAEDSAGNKLRLNAYVDEVTQSLVIEDQTSESDRIAGYILKVEELGKGRVARQLGIQTENTSGTIVGRDLVPLTLTTSLEDLRRGSGVELGSFQIQDRMGNTAIIDISQAETLADVRELINLAGTNLRSEINTGGSGLILADSSGSLAGQSIQITEVGENSHTAEDLGILTPANGISGSILIGESLDPQITRNTPLSLLNRGQGLELGQITVNNGPVSATIDLSKASTIGHILDAINSAGLDLKASINKLGTGISVTSNTGGRTFKISNAPGSISASNLGIEGFRDILVDRVVPLGEKGDLLPAVDGETRLKDINGGEGFNPGIIRITDSMGQATNVTLKGVNTLQGVINLINSYGYNGSGKTNIVAELSPDQQSIQLIDYSIPNTQIETVTETGALSSDFSDLTSGKTVVVNAFRSTSGELIARSVDIVTTTLSSEETLSGTIESVNEDTGYISLRSTDGVLYDVYTEQPLQNFFAGQSVFTNGVFGLTGEFIARSADLVTNLAEGEERLQASIDSADELNKTLTLSDNQGNTQQVRIITERQQIEVLDLAEGTAAADLGILGSSVVGSDRIQGNILNPVISDSTKLSLLNGGTFVAGKIQISNGHNTDVIDLSAAETVGEMLTLINASSIGALATVNSSGKGISIQSRINGATLTVSKIALENLDGTNKTYEDGSTVFDTTSDLLQISGSSDVLGTLFYLRNSLQNNNLEDVARTLDNFTGALNRILNQRTTVGTRTNQMTTTQYRGENTKLNNTEILSGIEDVDIVEAVNRLAAQENAYEAALAAAGRVILPSLLDYL
ncbi:flagellar hook-associated protein FlgL [Gemmatimonadota bacterium]